MCTISLKTKPSFYNCLMQGSPDLKSRLQEAVSVSHLAGACRPTSLGTKGTRTRQGRSRAVGSARGLPSPRVGKRTHSVSSHLQGRATMPENVQFFLFSLASRALAGDTTETSLV